jgi:hypothetical protein
MSYNTKIGEELSTESIKNFCTQSAGCFYFPITVEKGRYFSLIDSVIYLNKVPIGTIGKYFNQRSNSQFQMGNFEVILFDEIELIATAQKDGNAKLRLDVIKEGSPFIWVQYTKKSFELFLNRESVQGFQGRGWMERSIYKKEGATYAAAEISI